MFSDVSPDGKDEQGHDVSTHLPGPLGTVLNSFKPSIMMRLRRRRSTIPERSKGEGGRICLQERKMKYAWLPAFGVTGPIWIWLQGRITKHNIFSDTFLNSYVFHSKRVAM